MTNGNLIDLFHQKFPKLKPIDFRPLALDYVDGRKGLTIWLDNGDIILWFPKEGDL